MVLKLIKKIIKINKNAKIIVCSALGREIYVIEAIQAGSKDFIFKPFNREQVLETIEKNIVEWNENYSK